MKSNLIAQIIAFFSMLLGANMVISVLAYSRDYNTEVYLSLIVGAIAILCGVMVLIKSSGREKKEMPYVAALALMLIAAQVIAITRALETTFGSALFILYFELFLAAPTILVVLYFIKTKKEIKYVQDHPVEESPSFLEALDRIKETSKED